VATCLVGKPPEVARQVENATQERTSSQWAGVEELMAGRGIVPTAGMYRLRGVYEPWGDYGNILISGLVGRDEESGLLVIHRTAPFVPPISVAGLHSPVVVTDSFRRELAASGLTGFGFQPVVKQRIVRLAWERWDRGATEPAEYPAEGEPENYVLGRQHDPELAEAIGPLWELLVESEDVALGQPDFLRDTRYFSSVYVSPAAQQWLAARVGEWLRFEDPSSRDQV
jgi:hypothetical protein